MQYNISSLFEYGRWNTLLVVISDTPMDYSRDTKVIKWKQDDGSTMTITVWQTDGLHRTIEQNGKYYYWFLVQNQETRIVDNPAYYKAEAEELLNLLGQVAEKEYNNALEVITGV